MADTAAGKKSELDRAFPSIVLMGAALALALCLIFICGWKIVLLENEREDTEQGRLALERDRDAFLTYASELPQMEERHHKLTEDLARLEARQKFLAKSNVELEARREALNLEIGGLSGASANLTAQIQGLNKELGESGAALRKIRPELAQREKELALLRAQEGALRESIQTKQKNEAALAASIAGLERAKAQAEDYIKILNEDRTFFEASQKKHDELIAAFESILARSGALSEEYAGRVEEMGRAGTALNKGVASFETDLKSLAGHLDGIRQDRATHAALLKTAGEQSKALQQQVDGVAASNRKFGSALESVQGLDKKVQAALAAEVKTLAKWAGEDADTRARLAAAAQTLGQSVDAFKTDQANARARADEIVGLAASHRDELRKITEMAAEFVIHAEKSRETSLAGLKSGASLQEMAQALQKQAERLQSRLDSAELQGSQMEKLMDGERDRLHELSRLAKETRDSISASNHQTEETRAALAEILSLLRKTDSDFDNRVKHE